MDKKTWQNAKKLFHEAFELPDHQRANFLAENCQDENLCREVEELLAFHENDSKFINQSAVVESGLIAETSDFIGKQIGHYKIMHEIGRGGMGVVYEAARHDFNQKVALKVIKRGMDTDFILRHFQNERQILASLSHPNIARLLDGGTTDDGLPYFVMEFIDGEPLLKFCDANLYSVEERLKLFREICSAVSYAHQNLIVHKDLKPSNILITQDGTPKLLDFGIAKIINSESEGLTAASGDFVRLFTPEYASPEQIRGERITTSSDVYSLGVILYELLSGHNPFRRKNQTSHEWLQIICETLPERPSDAVTARHGDAETQEDRQKERRRERETTPKSEIRNPKLLRGDLDNIILKALQKDPTRRYLSVQELSEDIQRNLVGLPVTAQADSFSYRASKFVKRHRVGVFAGLLVFLSLVAGISATVWEAYRANQERAKAEKRFNDVRKLANSVVFEYHDGIAKLAGSTAIRKKMVKDALEYLDNLSAESGNDTELKRELAKAYVKVGDVQGNPYFSNLGNIDGAVESYQKASAIRKELFQANPADAELKNDLADSYNTLGDIYWAKGNNEESLADYQKAQKIYEELAAADSQNQHYQAGIAYCLNGIGHVQTQLSDYKNAQNAYEKALKIRQNILATDPNNVENRESVSGTYLKLGDSDMDNEDTQNALTNFEKGYDILTELSKTDPNNERILRKLALADGRLARVYTQLKQDENAVEFDNKALEREKKLAEIDPNDTQIQTQVATTYQNLADDFLNLKKLAPAEKSIKQAIREFEDVFKKSPGVLQDRETYGVTIGTYAQILTTKGEYQKAIEQYQKSIEILEDEKVRKSGIIYLAYNYSDLGDIQIMLTKKEKSQRSEHLKEAENLFRKSLEILNELPDSNADKADLIKKVSEKLSKTNR